MPCLPRIMSSGTNRMPIQMVVSKALKGNGPDCTPHFSPKFPVEGMGAKGQIYSWQSNAVQ